MKSAAKTTASSRASILWLLSAATVVFSVSQGWAHDGAAKAGTPAAAVTAIHDGSHDFEQSFSRNGGKTWEVNWIADDTRIGTTTKAQEAE